MSMIALDGFKEPPSLVPRMIEKGYSATAIANSCAISVERARRLMSAYRLGREWLARKEMEKQEAKLAEARLKRAQKERERVEAEQAHMASEVEKAFSLEERDVLTPRQIVDYCAYKAGMTRREFLVARRNKTLVWPRFEAMYLCAVYTSASLPKIGEALGWMDHTTIINGIRRHCERNAVPLPRGMKQRQPRGIVK